MNIFLDKALEDDILLAAPPAPPIVQTVITEAKTRIRKGYYDVITESFKWSAKVKRRFRDNIDVNELNDPLNLYGQWVERTKVTAGYICYVELHMEQEVVTDTIYVSDKGEQFLATGAHTLELSIKCKKRKDIANPYKAGEFLTLIKYANP